MQQTITSVCSWAGTSHSPSMGNPFVQKRNFSKTIASDSCGGNYLFGRIWLTVIQKSYASLHKFGNTNWSTYNPSAGKSPGTMFTLYCNLARGKSTLQLVRTNCAYIWILTKGTTRVDTPYSLNLTAIPSGLAGPRQLPHMDIVFNFQP